MGLTQQLEAFKEQVSRTAPAERALYEEKIEELRATFAIGRVVLSHVDVDYRNRLAPKAILQALRMA